MVSFGELKPVIPSLNERKGLPDFPLAYFLAITNFNDVR